MCPRIRRSARDAFWRTTGRPVASKVLTKQCIALLSMKVRSSKSITIGCPGTMTSSILSWSSWIVATSSSPLSTKAPVGPVRTVKSSGLETDIALSTRRQPQLEPDLLTSLVRIHAPGVGNRVHEEQSSTASYPGARWSRVRVEHRTGIEDLHSDDVVPPDTDDHGLYAAASVFDRIRHELGQQQLDINQDRFWQVGSDGFHHGSRLGRSCQRGWKDQLDALHVIGDYPSPLHISHRTCDRANMNARNAGKRDQEPNSSMSWWMGSTFEKLSASAIG